MSALSQVLGNAGAQHTFDHKGKTYKLRMLDQAAKDAFQKHLFGKARAAAMELKSAMDQEAYAEHLAKLNDDFILGEYSLESNRGQKYLQTTAGQLFLASHIFGADDMELVNVMMERADEVVALVKLVLQESLPAASKAKESDPNGQPATTA